MVKVAHHWHPVMSGNPKSTFAQYANSMHVRGSEFSNYVCNNGLLKGTAYK